MLRNRWKWIWLAAGMVATVPVLTESFAARAEESRPAAPFGPHIFFNLQAAGGGEEQASAVVLGGTRVTVTAAGKPDTKCTVQLGYQGTVVRQVPMQLGEKGFGECSVSVPDVRGRAECELVIVREEGMLRRQVVVLSSAGLAPAAGLIERRRLGLIDERGRLQRALEAENVAFKELSTRLLQDSFDGGVTVVAGFANADLLSDACQRLEGRIKEGMSVIVVNPPEAWQGWNISVRKLPAALAAPVTFAEGIGELVRQTDLGTGPRSFALQDRGKTVDDAARQGPTTIPGGALRVLAWVETTTKDETGKSNLEKQPLIAARRIGSGLAVVVLLPEVESPAADAVGRGVLDEVVLWVLQQSEEKGK